MSRIAGICHITVNGRTLDISGGLTIPLSKTNKETIVSTNGSVNYKETPIAPYIDGTFLMDENFPIEELASMDTATVVAELANRKSYTLSEAFIEGEMNYDSDAGTVGMKFVGTNGRWS